MKFKIEFEAAEMAQLHSGSGATEWIIDHADRFELLRGEYFESEDSRYMECNTFLEAVILRSACLQLKDVKAFIVADCQEGGDECWVVTSRDVIEFGTEVHNRSIKSLADEVKSYRKQERAKVVNSKG